MQHEDFNLVRGRMPQLSRILGGDFDGSGDFSGDLLLMIGHFRAGGQQHVDCALQPGGAAGARHEAVEAELAQICYALLEDDQVRCLTPKEALIPDRC